MHVAASLDFASGEIYVSPAVILSSSNLPPPPPSPLFTLTSHHLLFSVSHVPISSPTISLSPPPPPLSSLLLPPPPSFLPFPPPLSEPKQVEKLWTSSYSCLMEGLERFQSSANVPNQALLYANLGNLMRSCAQAYGAALGEEEERGEFTPQEKLYYGKAAEFYIQGKQVRGGA